MKERFIYGKNPIKEKLKVVKKGVLNILKDSNLNHYKEIIEKAKSKNIEIVYLDRESFLKFFPDISEKIVLKIDEDYAKIYSEDEFLNEIENNSNIKNIIILDGVKDVGNFGAIIRSALLFDIDFIVLPKDNSAPINEVVAKRSAGAISFMNISYVTNIVRVIEFLKKNGFWVYAASKNGKPLKDFNFSEKNVIVFGEEGRGIRRLVKENCDDIITIETNDKLDSLNLSVSAGIILYELRKKAIN
ncbi:MAG TPA: 23S rRNA (guanosine(2251)-2'-O)-methyltransferase RlmB [Spirochaetota bacterium]|nr:23S rRNA (guanosine(2251)-2'-O)-methyltransferase RlmB [Spirochaetota bacterium]HOL57600.1 23S rRNA (guanosine(2251)-2'-O)-methyltransferase RlmB [Spirochaetota bacterium]HPP05097.1 23S rRNA (guanosine(2251)-2'-O)-methyltransferase RlmB [Spirochaetota bacterium]